jgi:hypothetical protein
MALATHTTSLTAIRLPVAEGSDDSRKRPRSTSDSPDTRLDRPSRPSLRYSAERDFGPRYRVISQIGRGGMGEVFRAYDAELKGEVALKIVRDDTDLENALGRFRREIALARKVTSPHVLRVYDIAEHEGLRFVSMEFVEGEDLAALLKRERLSLDRALAIFRQVCAGLVAAHAEGVVHRDLKPHNILVGKDDRVRVADFGLARSIGESGLTASGAILGSPGYMSPEQVKGDPTDERSDIYSLGVLLYQLVTGEPPFRGDTPHAVMEMRLHKKPPPLPDTVPAYLQPIVSRCLEVDPVRRYERVSDLVADLGASREGPAQPPPRRRWLPVAIVGVIAAAGAVTIAVVASQRHEPEKATAQAAPTPPPTAPADANMAKSRLPTLLLIGIENRAGDPTFDGALDVVVTYRLRRSTILNPLEPVTVQKLATSVGAESAHDPHLAAKVAARDGVRVMTIEGTVTANGAGFDVAFVVTDSNGKKLFTQSRHAANLGDVVVAASGLADDLRTALGEQLSEHEREQLAVSSSLEADHELAMGRQLLQFGDIPGSVSHLTRAVGIDPEFPLGHLYLALALENARRPVDAQGQYRLLLGSLDRMGDRDRLKVLGDYHRAVTEELDRAVSSYEQLLATWPDDLAAATNLALAHQLLGQLAKAVEIGDRVAKEYPWDPAVRANAAVFRLAAGDFNGAIEEVHREEIDLPRPLPIIYQYLEIASLFLSKRPDAIAALDKFAKLDPALALPARADLALAEGRLRDAAALLDRGIADDVAQHNDDALEIKREMLAELKLRRGDKAGARTAAAQVTKQPLRRLQAALVSVAAGDDVRARAVAADFAKELAPSRRAMAKLIEAELLRIHGKPAEAVVALQDALRLTDSPLGHYLLARAALDAKAYPEAYSEPKTCLSRAPEAAFDIEDIPTYRNVPPFTYYLAKAQEALGSKDAKATYQAFVAIVKDADADDPLAADAKAHAQ